MSVVDGVKHDLAALPPDLQESGLAMLALAMAERIDGGRCSAEFGKVLSDALSRLRDLAPPKQERSRLDELTERRQCRLAGGADTAH